MAEKKQDTTSETPASEKTPDQLLESVRSQPKAAGFGPMSVSADQEPVEITGYRGNEPLPDPTNWATPVDGVDGGDGSHTTVQSKVDDYVWAPFVAPASWPTEADLNEDGTIWNDTPYGQTQSTGNDTAVIASNALTKF